MSIALTILGISVLIILHELGHYLAARLTGMRVLKFSLGFGPKLFEKKIGETHWQVAAVLLGGYVQVHGMGPQDPSMPADDERSYRNKPLWQRALVIAAGPVANWLLAAVFIFALAISVGYSQFDESLPMLGEIVAGEPAAAAGLQENDRVLAVGGETVTDWPTLVTQIQRHPGKLVVLDIERGSERLSIEVTPRDEDGVGKFGVYPPSVTIKPGLGASLQAGFMGACGRVVSLHFITSSPRRAGPSSIHRRVRNPCGTCTAMATSFLASKRRWWALRSATTRSSRLSPAKPMANGTILR